MGKCYSTDHITDAHTHTDITCNTEEPQLKHRLGTANNRLLGELEHVLPDPNLALASAIVQPNRTITTNAIDQQT